PPQVSLPRPAVAAAGLADARHREALHPPDLTLEGADANALQSNPTPQAARAALNAALARVGIVKSANGVQVGASGSIQTSRGFGGNSGIRNTGTGTGGTGNTTGGSSGFSTNEEFGLNVTLPLYNGGRVKAAQRAAQASARAQLATTQQTEQELAAQTILSYLGVLQTQELLEVAQSNLETSRERRRIAGVRFDAGAAARLEVLRADAILAAAQQRRIAASNGLAQSKAALNILLARAPETPVRLEPIQTLQLPAAARLPLAEQATAIASGGAVPPSAQLREVAEAALPSLEATREGVNTADFNVDAQRAQRRPSIGASLSGILRNPVQFASRFLLGAGLSVAQTIFDSGRIRSQITEAQAQAQQARFGLSGQQLQVANAIEGSLLTLDSARKRLASSDVGVLAAAEALRAAQLSFSAGAGTPLDVTDAQNALVAAQNDAVNARFEVAQAQVQLAAATAITQGGSATGRTGLGSSAGTGQNSTLSASGANQSNGTPAAGSFGAGGTMGSIGTSNTSN
ncbi:MAG: TolC family protein, partial [Armatimonadetes bacterium]|nr:TolC family protein [Armatimonadota bacterium]